MGTIGTARSAEAPLTILAGVHKYVLAGHSLTGSEALRAVLFKRPGQADQASRVPPTAGLRLCGEHKQSLTCGREHLNPCRHILKCLIQRVLQGSATSQLKKLAKLLTDLADLGHVWQVSSGSGQWYVFHQDVEIRRRMQGLRFRPHDVIAIQKSLRKDQQPGIVMSEVHLTHYTKPGIVSL